MRPLYDELVPRLFCFATLFLLCVACSDGGADPSDSGSGDTSSTDSGSEDTRNAADAPGSSTFNNGFDDDTLGTTRIPDNANLALTFENDACDLWDFRGTEDVGWEVSDGDNLAVIIRSQFMGNPQDERRGYLAIQLARDFSTDGSVDVSTLMGFEGMSIDDLSESPDAPRLAWFANQGTIRYQGIDLDGVAGTFVLDRVGFSSSIPGDPCLLSGSIEILGTRF